VKRYHFIDKDKELERFMNDFLDGASQSIHDHIAVDQPFRDYFRLVMRHLFEVNPDIFKQVSESSEEAIHPLAPINTTDTFVTTEECLLNQLLDLEEKGYIRHVVKKKGKEFLNTKN